MGFSVISDPLPGYLDSYLGDWEYHKGLLKMYRANDLALFETAKVRMFVYRTDKSSTSYETELAYLQSSDTVGDENRFFAYHYDIGEAVLGAGTPYERAGRPVEFGFDEYLSLCRMDITDDCARDGEYFTDGRHTLRFMCEKTDFSVKCGENFAIMGVMKPWQMDPHDFVLRDDNTFEVKNFPKKIKFTVSDGENKKVFLKNTGLVRYGDGPEESSVFEFYSVFTTDGFKAGQTLGFSAVCIDKYGKETPARSEFLVNVV